MTNKTITINRTYWCMVMLALMSMSIYLVNATDLPFCDGIFDIAIVDDSSGSVVGTPWDQIKEFNTVLIKNFTISKDKTWMGIYKFSDSRCHDWEIKMTYNRQDLLNTASSMTHCGPFQTDIYTAVKNAQIGIVQDGRPNVQNWMFVVTDALQNVGYSVGQLKTLAQSVRNEGTEIFAIGVGDVNRTILADIASKPIADHMIVIPYFSGLVDIVGRLLYATCTRSLRVTPDHVCAGVAGQVVDVFGNGFANNNRTYCKFGTASNAPTTHGVFKNATMMGCPVPKWTLDPGANWTVPVFLSIDNGNSWLQSTAYIHFSPCPDAFAVVGGLLGALAVLALLPLAGLIARRYRSTKNAPVVEGTPIAEPSLLPAVLIPPAKKQWHRPNIEYLWPGIGQGAGGGARPVYIEWGTTGAPPDRELAADEKTDVDYVAAKAVEPQTDEPGCWDRFTQSCSACWEGFMSKIRGK